MLSLSGDYKCVEIEMLKLCINSNNKYLDHILKLFGNFVFRHSRLKMTIAKIDDFHSNNKRIQVREAKSRKLLRGKHVKFL